MLEGNANLLNFLCNSIHPESVAGLAVEGKGFLDSLRHFYAKLVGPFEIAGTPFVNKRNDPATLLQYMGNPPDKGWLVVML